MGTDHLSGRAWSVGALVAALAAVWAVAAVGKIMDPELMAAVRGADSGSVLTVMVGLGELLLAAAILVRRTRRSAMLVSTGVAGAFFLYNLLGLDLSGMGSCNCLGSLVDLDRPSALRLDIALLFGSVVGLGVTSGGLGAPGGQHPTASGRRWAIGLAVWLTVLLALGLAAKGRTAALLRRREAAPTRYRLNIGDKLPATIRVLDGRAGARWFVTSVVDPGCPPCKPWLQAVAAAARQWGDAVAVQVVVRGRVDDCCLFAWPDFCEA